MVDNTPTGDKGRKRKRHASCSDAQAAPSLHVTALAEHDASGGRAGKVMLDGRIHNHILMAETGYLGLKKSPQTMRGMHMKCGCR